MLGLGTLRSGALYVAVTRGRTNRKPIRGVFAARNYERGDYITAYGGVLCFGKSEQQGLKGMYKGQGVYDPTHGRHVPNTALILSGAAWAETFPQPSRQDKQWYRKQARLDACDRAHIQPVTDGASITETIRQSGIGYLINTARRSLLNCRVEVLRNPVISANHCSIPFLIISATKHINCHEELFCEYKNNDPFSDYETSSEE